MKAKLLSSLLLGSAMLVSGCGMDSYPEGTPAGPGPVTPANYTSPQMQTDAKILGAVVALNETEIAAARLAEKRAKNPAVKHYADWMKKEHGQNLQQTEAVAQRLGVPPVKGEAARTLHAKGKQGLASLSHLHAGAFDRAYIAHMVKGHEAALHLLNHKLIPEAKNPVLKRQLEATRNHVSAHLKKAIAIQAQLAGH